MKTEPLLIFAALCLGIGSAQAQRRVLPVADLVEVPVSLATAKPLTSDQVRKAIIGAALIERWDVEPAGPGALKLSTWRDMEYRVTLEAKFSPSSYSLTYVNSEGLKTDDIELMSPMSPTGETLASYAAKWRAIRAARVPEHKFAVDRSGKYIHPTYELMLYELSAGIKRHLKAAELQP